MIQLILPSHLRTLAGVGSPLPIAVAGVVTQRSILDAVEASYPVLRGTIRDLSTKRRRPMIRFFVCGQDVSHEAEDAPLPAAVAVGGEPFLIVGAIAGG